MLEAFNDALVPVAKWFQDHEWIGESTLFLVTPGQGLDAKAIELGDKIGFDPETLKYVLCLLIAYPLSAVFARLPGGAAVKHGFSLLMGLWMMQFIYYSQWIHSFLTATIAYLFILVLPNRMMPQAVFVFNMAYIFSSHLYRMYIDYMGWAVDFTGPQMVLVMKLTSIAYNVYDGRVWGEIEKDTGDRRKDKVLAARRKFAIRKTLSPLEFFGYIYCFTSILVGPAFEYAEYIGTITGSSYEKNGSPTKRKGNTLPALKKLLVGIVCLAVNQVVGAYFPIQGAISDKMLERNVFYRCGWTWLSLLCVRCKYYFAWKVADGSAVLAGFGFQGYDDQGNSKGWDGVSNMNILGFELASNMQDNAREWNKRTQGWLERYVYMRTGNSLMATYFTSAFWHGSYPGYYLFFMSLPVATMSARAIRKKISPHIEIQADGKTPSSLSGVYSIFCVVVNSFTINYLVLPFQMLSLEASLKVWGSFFFAGHVAVVVLYVACFFIPAKQPGDANGKKSNPSTPWVFSKKKTA